MPFGYKEAFGLSDNPFGPRRQVGGLPPNLTQELEKRPLLLHRDSRLDHLYCEKLPSFNSACLNFQALVEADGYTADPPQRGVTSYMVMIGGDRGAGKTTLASRLLQLMLKRCPEGEPKWHVEELLLRSSKDTVTEQVEKLKALETKITAQNEQYLCVLIDDLLGEAFPYAEDLYDTLTENAAIFLVLTSCDPAIAEQIDKALHTVQRFAIAPLTPDDAIAYVNARYQMFRLPAANGINALPLFPFDETDIRNAVKARVLSGATTTGPVNMRMLASILQSALASRLQEIARHKPGFDVRGVAADKLAELLINVAQSYKIAVRTK